MLCYVIYGRRITSKGKYPGAKKWSDTSYTLYRYRNTHEDSVEKTNHPFSLYQPKASLPLVPKQTKLPTIINNDTYHVIV